MWMLNIDANLSMQAESTNRALLADISERDEKISRLKSTEKELPQLRDRISELQDKV